MDSDNIIRLSAYLMVNKISSQYFIIIYDFFNYLMQEYLGGHEIVDGKKILFLGRILRVVTVKSDNHVIDAEIKLKQLKLNEVLENLKYWIDNKTFKANIVK